MYFRNAAAKAPARTVETLQASCVYSPAPQITASQRSTPPIIPAIIPAGAPKRSPAQIGEASLAFIIAPSILIPNSVPRIASAPNIMPIITCLAIYDILLAAFVRSVR